MFQMSQPQRLPTRLLLQRGSTLGGALSLVLTGCGSIGLDLGRDIAATYADPGDTTDKPDAMVTGSLLCPDADGELVLCAPSETPRPNSLCPESDSMSHCAVALPVNAELERIDDVEPRDPAVPGSAFLWKYGVGNWFAVVGNPSTFGETLISSVDASAVALTPPRGASTRAYHVHEQGDHINLLIELDHPERRALDLRAYAGLTFVARVDVNSDWFYVGFNGVEVGSSAVGRFIGLPRYGEWQRYVLLFDRIFGVNREILGALKTISFAAPASVEPVDLWVDDVALICDGACP